MRNNRDKTVAVGRAGTKNLRDLWDRELTGSQDPLDVGKERRGEAWDEVESGFGRKDRRGHCAPGEGSMALPSFPRAKPHGPWQRKPVLGVFLSLGSACIQVFLAPRVN